MQSKHQIPKSWKLAKLKTSFSVPNWEQLNGVKQLAVRTFLYQDGKSRMGVF